jgi:hypothetical protein
MIDVCFDSEENESLGPFNRTTLLAQLEEKGLKFQRVEQLRPSETCLMFAAVDSKTVAGLSAEERSRVVLVVEGNQPAAVAAEATRQALGFLGLVEPHAWRSWQRGLFVAWGLYGRPDVAQAAGLVPRDTQGLQPANDRESLPSVLTRFLLAAEFKK